MQRLGQKEPSPPLQAEAQLERPTVERVTELCRIFFEAVSVMHATETQAALKNMMKATSSSPMSMIDG